MIYENTLIQEKLKKIDKSRKFRKKIPITLKTLYIKEKTSERLEYSTKIIFCILVVQHLQ